MTCSHWQNTGHKNGGRCALHNRTISFGVCDSCPDSTEIGWVKKMLRTHRPGDKIAAMTRAAGIRPCGGCKGRQAKLNGEGLA
jgi:hypothetical protein